MTVTPGLERVKSSQTGSTEMFNACSHNDANDGNKESQVMSHWRIHPRLFMHSKIKGCHQFYYAELPSVRILPPMHPQMKDRLYRLAAFISSCGKQFAESIFVIACVGMIVMQDTGREETVVSPLRRYIRSIFGKKGEGKETAVIK